MVDNPIDKVINRKAVVEGVNKEINRRRNISKKTKGKKRTRKDKNKGKKRKKKKVTTTQVAQPPIRLSNKDGDKLEVNIVAKERRKKRAPKSYAQKRAEEIAKTGIADPSILKQQQRVASEILGYNTQTRDPLALRGSKGRYNVSGGVGGFSNVSGVYQDRFGRGRQGLRTGAQSEAIGRDTIIAELEDMEFKRQIEARRNRQPTFRPNFRTFGTQTKKGDDDSSDDDDPPPRPNVKTGRTPQPKSRLLQPQPEPEPVPRTPTPSPSVPKQTRSTSTFTAPLQTISTGTSPINIPAPLPRRTPPESYFAGRLAPDTPIRFRPISQPLPDDPADPEETDEEIAGLTGGDSPEQVGFIPISPPQQPAQDPTPEPFDPDDEGFATPTLTESQAQFPAPRPVSRQLKQLPASLVRPSSREALEREGITFTDTPESIGTGGAFVRPQTRQSPEQPQPEPEPIQSVRRGRGRPKGSKNKPRSDTPAILESTKDIIQAVDLKLTMNKIAGILRRRLGSFSMKDLDDIQSLAELQELILGMNVDDETAGLLQDFWQIRIQLGKIKKV